MLTNRFKIWFDRFGLVAGGGGIAIGIWDRTSGRDAIGNYLLALGTGALAIALVSISLRRRRS